MTVFESLLIDFVNHIFLRPNDSFKLYICAITGHPRHELLHRIDLPQSSRDVGSRKMTRPNSSSRQRVKMMTYSHVTLLCHTFVL